MIHSDLSIQQNFVSQEIDFLTLTVAGDVFTVSDSQISGKGASSVTLEERVQVVVVPTPNSTPSTSSAPKRMSLQTDLGKLMLLPGTVFKIKQTWVGNNETTPEKPQKRKTKKTRRAADKP